MNMKSNDFLTKAAMTLFLAVFSPAGLWADTTISTYEQLKAFVASTVDNNYEGQTVTLAADIDCGGQAFVTATDQTVFCGTFDGGGHKISNFVNPSAMFRSACNGAVIKDLTLSGTVNVEESAAVSGGLVAKGTNVVATKCSFNGTVAGLWTLGGLIGEATDCTFTDCSFEGTLSGGPNETTASNGGCGGLVGYADNSTFADCTSNATINWVIRSDYNEGKGRTNSQNFTAVGGAAGVTLGESKFTNCTVEGSIESKYGYVGGFVGWTAGKETFNQCSTSASINASKHYDNIIGDGGFAASVASDGARFVDCYTSSQGKNIRGGFYNVQHPKSGVTIGGNTFQRCTVDNVPVYAEDGVSGGFCVSTWNGTFNSCTVRGGKPNAGFVLMAGKEPTSDYNTEQTSTFDDCAVIGAEVALGFVGQANSNNKANNVNIFRRCRAACLYNQNNPNGGNTGFGSELNASTLVEDCTAYGVQLGKSDLYGFADDVIGKDVDNKAVVRRCVAAVLPLSSTEFYGGFASDIGYYTTVEDCYSVYGPRVATTNSSSDGVQGGFVRRYSGRYDDNENPITRCFALGIVLEGSSTHDNCGSFCGKVNNTDNPPFFAECYRPAESLVGDVSNNDDDGITAFTAQHFASATAATMPDYDFADTWRAPQGVASSPYLAASTDAEGNFWTFATILSGEGHILINGEEPKEAYPAGSVLTIEAVPKDPDIPFTGWVGYGIADPTERVTTYTVKNVGVIAATFANPIRTREELVAIGTDENRSGNYYLASDIDLASSAWTPLCQDESTAFTGSLYGRGYKIKNMNVEGTDSYAGLFGYLKGATVKGLVIDGVTVSGSSYVGAVAGYASDQTVISDCIVNGAAISATGDDCGAILGSHDNSSLINNYYVGTTVNDNDSNVGCNGEDVTGARRVYTLTLDDGIATTRTGTAAAIGNGYTVYADGFSSSSKEYYTAESKVTLTGASGFKVLDVSYTPEGGTAANVTDGGNGTWSFNMPAKNVTVTATTRAIVNLTITADSDTKEYDGTALKKNSFTNTALVEDDHIESVIVTGSQTSVGTSDNVPSAAVIKDASDVDVTAAYNITYVNGKLTVTAKTVNSPTISLSETCFAYDGQEKKPAVIVKDGETTVSADEYSVSYSNNTNVGTATVTITDKEGGNYTVSGTATFEIRPMGDANADKVVDAVDIVEMVNAKKGQPSAKFNMKFADFDGNGQITDEDIYEVLKIIMGED